MESWSPGRLQKSWLPVGEYFKFLRDVNPSWTYSVISFSCEWGRISYLNGLKPDWSNESFDVTHFYTKSSKTWNVLGNIFSFTQRLCECERRLQPDTCTVSGDWSSDQSDVFLSSFAQWQPGFQCRFVRKTRLDKNINHESCSLCARLVTLLSAKIWQKWQHTEMVYDLTRNIHRTTWVCSDSSPCSSLYGLQPLFAIIQ